MKKLIHTHTGRIFYTVSMRLMTSRSIPCFPVGSPPTKEEIKVLRNEVTCPSSHSDRTCIRSYSNPKPYTFVKKYQFTYIIKGTNLLCDQDTLALSRSFCLGSGKGGDRTVFLKALERPPKVTAVTTETCQPRRWPTDWVMKPRMQKHAV